MSNKIKYYKIVLLPIEVANGDFCWGGNENRICPHFDNEGGFSSCDLGFDIPKHNELGWIPKPIECLKLQERKD